MTSPTLYLFVGYPGAGKTTVAKLIASSSGAVHLWADHERRNMFDTVTHSASESTELYRRLNDKADQLLAAGTSVIFDTNFNYKADREYLKTIANKHNARTCVIWITTPKEVARERATHPAHSDRNRYQQPMSEAEFNQLSNHLEIPTPDENYIAIDGSNLDIDQAKLLLGL